MKAADKTLSKRYARAYMALDGAAFDKHGDAAARPRIEELEKARRQPVPAAVPPSPGRL